jgi:hypothetical protein
MKTKAPLLDFSKLKWVITDPATNQQGRQLTDVLFEFKEDGKEQRGIDLSGLKNKEIEQCINAYGYTLFETKGNNRNIKELYGKDANWIIAECLFECDM